MTGNLDLWNKLGKTDPKQTKPFNRAGGFKGTAIKPIYTEQKMTEQFGPCGVGWGIDEPKFETAPGNDGQLAVYCWVSIWVNVDGKVSAPIYGVGGDMVVVKQSAGLRTDDEAFKKAFTDAVGNAMKHLGMSADVHLGRFDDSKYVSERTAEEAGQSPKLALVSSEPPRDAAFFDGRIDAATTAEAVQRIQADLKDTDESLIPQTEFDRLWAKAEAKAKSMHKKASGG
jgi:hypothetical protein